MSAPPLPRSRLAAVRRAASLAPMAAALMALAALGCEADHTSRTLLGAPQSGVYAIQGHIRLTGVLADEGGHELGGQVVDQANDVKVHVEGPAGYRDSVLTQGGVFTFGVDAPGHYRVSCCVVSGDTAGHVDVDVVDPDTTHADLLTLGSPTGIINTYPNPFPASGVGVEASIATPQRVEISFRTLFGFRVWHYDQDTPSPGYFLHIHWIGVDDANNPQPDGYYWAVLNADGVNSFSLVEKRTTGATVVFRPAPSRASRRAAR